jgi:thiol-disulfide isomerase/thioredoxin
MLDRLIVAGAIIIIGVTAWVLYNRWAVRRAAQLAPVDPLLAHLPTNVPTILYFTTPFCEPCRTQQQPTLAALERELAGRVQVIKVDATEQPEAADRWGVFSAPTTFVIDQRRTPRHVNRGVASLDTLKKQLELA